MFEADTHPSKINLGVGVYRDSHLRPFVFDVVQKASHALDALEVDHEYLPIVGLKEFREYSSRLVFGEDSDAIAERRVGSVQSLSGTGALRLCFDFLKVHDLVDRVYVSDPTWGNHPALVAAAGFPPVERYAYFDAATGGLAFDALMESFASMPPRSAVVLQACAHNPSGVDPTHEQWEAILALCKERGIVPVMDFAYQGFASGDLDEDAFAIRAAVSMGLEIFVCQSFAKNMGLYSERVGALHIVTQSAAATRAACSLMALIVRKSYSNPPAFGARIVASILSSSTLMARWRKEVVGVVQRIKAMRVGLRTMLESRHVRGPWTHIESQIGMFTLTGLDRAEVKALQQLHVFMLANGRINMAGLSKDNLAYFVDCIASARGVEAAPASPAVVPYDGLK